MSRAQQPTYTLNTFEVNGSETKTVEVWTFPFDRGAQQVVAKSGDAHFYEQLPDYHSYEFVLSRAISKLNQQSIDA